VNELAPEHLEIITRDTDAVAANIKHAGAIFSARTRLKPSAIISGQTMFCRRAAQRFFRARCE
jgi:hypothetical protein